VSGKTPRVAIVSEPRLIMGGVTGRKRTHMPVQLPLMATHVSSHVVVLKRETLENIVPGCCCSPSVVHGSSAVDATAIEQTTATATLKSA
jgi:hypothetical protein